MKILAIDTTEEACSAALWLDGEVLEHFELAPRRHSELILPMMDRLLADAGLSPGSLDALAFGRGPGSFTGVRIATGVVQGVALGADLPVVPVSTLQTLAQGAWRISGQQRVLAAFDARMKEVYWAACRLNDAGLMQPVGNEMVCAPDAVPPPEGNDWCGVGSGWAAYADVLTSRFGAVVNEVMDQLLPHAQDVAVLGAAGFNAGQAVAAELALPVYLRNQVAQKTSA